MSPQVILFSIFFYHLVKVIAEAVIADVNGRIYDSQEKKRRFPKRVLVTPTGKWYSLETYGSFYSEDYKFISDGEAVELAKQPGNKMLGFMTKNLYMAYLTENK